MSAFITFVLITLALNIWATRAILQSDGYHLGKKMLIASVWMLPILGALNSWLHIPRAPRRAPPSEGDAAVPGEVAEPAPEQLDMPEMLSLHLSDCMAVHNGIPFMDWAKLGAWAATAPDAAGERAAVTAGQRAWLLHLRDALGPHFRLLETEAAFVLSARERHVAQAAADYVARTRRRIAAVLGGVAQFAAGERSILLVLDDDDAYYHYISHYYADGGEYAFSSGVFLSRGCPHFVVKGGDLTHIEPVIVHEMTHSALAHLKLPRWLDEGIAVNTEHRITGAPRLIYTPQELRQKHLAFWGEAEIQQFWSGRSFHRTDDGNLLSYELARIIVERMAKDWNAFTQFALHASREDAGARAAVEHLDVDLGAYACALMERPRAEQWSPDPARWREAEAASTQTTQGASN